MNDQTEILAFDEMLALDQCQFCQTGVKQNDLSLQG